MRTQLTQQQNSRVPEEPGCTTGLVQGGSHPNQRRTTPPPTYTRRPGRPQPRLQHTNLGRACFTDGAFQQCKDEPLGQSISCIAGHLPGQDFTGANQHPPTKVRFPPGAPENHHQAPLTSSPYSSQLQSLAHTPRNARCR